MQKRAALITVGLLLFLCSGITWAQVNTGMISGTVRDTSGAALPGTEVTIVNEDTGFSRIVTTDDGGRYSAPALSLGNYQVTGTRNGFQTEVRTGIVLTVGREAVVDMSLGVGAVTQTLEVKGEAPLVESTTASLGSLVDDHTIRALPLNGRSYDQLALLQPGVIQASPGPLTGNLFNFGSGTRFSVGGQRPVSNSFLLDGTNINDQGNGTPGGAAGTNLGVDTILEFKIFTNSFKAEYGHSGGSVTSAITRSGTNALHGTAFEYIRNSALDDRNYFDVGSSPPSFKRNQFGGVLGGPIKKDKTFIFGGYEGLRQGLGTTQIATVPTAQAKQGILPTVTVPVNPAVVPYLNLYPLPNGRPFGDGTGQYLSSPTVITDEDNVMARVDEQLNKNNSIFGRYTFDDSTVNAPLSLPNESQLTTGRRQYTTLQANSILGPQILNSFRFAFNRTDVTFGVNTSQQLGFIPGQELGTIQVGGLSGAGTTRAITSLGPASGTGKYFAVFNIFEWGDDFTYVIGKHSLKAGVDLQRMQDNTSTGAFVVGTYTFPSFPSLLAGTPSNLQASNPVGVAPYFGLRQTLYGVYAQDDYAVNSRLTLNLGLRWEITTDPTAVNAQMAILPSPAATATVSSDKVFSITKKNFEPRLGLAWQLNASGKTVLRAGGGIYHNQIFPWLYYNQVSQPPFFGAFNAINPPFPNGYQILKPGGGLIALQVQAPLLKTPVTDQYNLSIQQQIFKNTVIEVAYAGSHANHLTLEREADTATPTFCSTSLHNCPAGLVDGQIYYPAGSPRLNPAWSGIRLYNTIGNSSYNSATVTLRRQLSSGFSGQIFYSYSKALDLNSNTAGTESVRSPQAVLDPFDIARDWGLADFDARNAVGFNFSYAFPFRTGSKDLGAVVNGWALNGIGTFRSGQPFTPRLSASVSRDLASTLTERPNLKPGFSNNPTSGTSAGCPGFAEGTPLGGPTNFYDPCAFSLPQAGTYGNLGRNTVIGPGFADVDLSLEKGFKLREKADVTFRAEMFNIMNHANFGLPNTTPLAASGAANPSAGVITYTTTSSRQLQFALRINF